MLSTTAFRSLLSSVRVPSALNFAQKRAFGTTPVMRHGDHDHDEHEKEEDAKWRSGADIDKHELHGILNHPWNLTLIDVREPEEYNVGFIPMAVNLSVNELERALSKLDQEEFVRQYGFEVPQKDKRIVVYCKSGVRSDFAKRIMQQLGVRNYRGSWIDWNKDE